MKIGPVEIPDPLAYMFLGGILGYGICLVADDEMRNVGAAAVNIFGGRPSVEVSTESPPSTAYPWEFVQACRPGYPDTLYNKTTGDFETILPREEPPERNDATGG